MFIIIRGFYTIAALLFATGSVIYFRDFTHRVPGPRRPRTMVVGYAILFQAIALAMYAVYMRQVPFQGLFQGFSFAAFVLAILFLTTTRVLADERPIGIIVLPLVCIFQAVGIFTPLEYVADPSLGSHPWFVLHAALGLFSYGAFVIAFASAALFLVLHRQLKTKRLGRFFERLPSLDELDYLTCRSVVTGLVALTLSIACGMVWTQVRTGRPLQGDPKEIITLINWAIYAFYLHSHYYRNWRGRRASWIAIAGFVLLLFNFVLVTVLFSRTHAYL
ncbi:MAG: cytochrome c biogenesis protein CcsA [Gemmatimonadota bacterium]|nr:cytochrome c biogenesis protein CcsA [Gemmatimonadota bacterium]